MIDEQSGWIVSSQVTCISFWRTSLVAQSFSVTSKQAKVDNNDIDKSHPGFLAWLEIKK